MITCFTIFIIAMLILMINNLEDKNCSYMESLYSKVNGKLRSIDASDPNCNYRLFDYYIFSAYNACSGGNYKNGVVNICNLKSVIKQGVRGLDFEIYSVNDKPVIATSTQDDYYIKETFNYVPFEDVIKTISNYAFSNGTCPNPEDPIILHLRIKSENQKIYTSMANTLQSYSDLLLGNEYSFEGNGENMGKMKLLDLKSKIFIIVDKSNLTFLDNTLFLEYVNLTSNSVFARCLEYSKLKDTSDVDELRRYNKKGFTIVLPNKENNPENPSTLYFRELGCQMVTMRHQLLDEFLKQNNLLFSRCSYSFCLKPERLRYKKVVVEKPKVQNKDYSYETRKKESDYYSFDI